MRILLAGGAGYVGSVLGSKLIERGYDVEVVDLLWFGNSLPSSIKVHQLDIFQLTEAQLRGFDQVIFLGGLSNDPMAEFSPSMNFIYNASAPAYLGYIAKRAGVRRLIYAGSCSVYGYTVNELYDEESPTISNYPYGISKLQGEQAVMHMADKDFSVICLRQGTISGYSPRMRLDLIVNTMFMNALSRNEITVNNPSIWRPILSIDDAIGAYTRAVEASQEICGIFNVASGNYTVGEIADTVKEAVELRSKKTVRLTMKNISDFRNYKVSIEKAMKVLSFKPKHGVDSIIENLFEHQDRFRDFDNPRYYNIQMFQKVPRIIHFEAH